MSGRPAWSPMDNPRWLIDPLGGGRVWSLESSGGVIEEIEFYQQLSEETKYKGDRTLSDPQWLNDTDFAVLEGKTNLLIWSLNDEGQFEVTETIDLSGQSALQKNKNMRLSTFLFLK